MAAGQPRGRRPATRRPAPEREDGRELVGRLCAGCKESINKEFWAQEADEIRNPHIARVVKLVLDSVRWGLGRVT